MIAPDYYIIRPSRGLNTAFFVSVCSVAPLKETMCKVHRQQQQCSTNNVVVDVGVTNLQITDETEVTILHSLLAEDDIQ